MISIFEISAMSSATSWSSRRARSFCCATYFAAGGVKDRRDRAAACRAVPLACAELIWVQ